MIDYFSADNNSSFNENRIIISITINYIYSDEGSGGSISYN
jgi:hypothetical protein